MRETIDGLWFKQMILSASALINLHKQEINELNVFPVPDGDTGTNMSLTIGTAAAELRKHNPETVGKAAEITANALLRGARGNSGVILSLLFRGVARSLRDKEHIGGAEFAAALGEGVSAAYNAVMKPAEGTILTVSRMVAKQAVDASERNQSIEFVLEEAIAEGKVALDNTIHQNPVLKKAGVIDAGGKGYLILLEGMLKCLQGEAIPDAPVQEEPAKERADFEAFATEDIKFGYCTEFIVSRENQRDPNKLRLFLCDLGDSLVFVDDDEIIKVHVHTNNPGVALEEALKYGPLLTVKVENMREQHTEILENAVCEATRNVAEPTKKYGFISVCAGKGIQAVFTDLGVDGIVGGGQTMNPATEDILREIDKTPSEIIYILPNNKNVILAAEQCVPLSEKKVIVLHTESVPQGVAAMLAVDPELEEAELTKAMTEAYSKVYTAQVTYAARDSEYDGFSITEGDYLALAGNQMFGTDKDLTALLARLAEMIAGRNPEFVTVFYGESVSPEEAERVKDLFSAACPSAETSLVYGGQPVYYYMISAE
ncbi:DAK2 domain-containing protein [Papillibacter cinnamivorans]|uniref:DhaL domain-containing protein n=1 Tax=Papillibacter cinnamivorans DSM 12816 TaxID=1122930 RepID=A0A1W2A3Z4_9FIRM|nr:DAK2 domain-containing protein [Papillibacter cinnamivorans]SMC55459.1 hypothetical protein SAMN02745168_1466 [Papillibacter cinnamivorans DSM 12816]